jgi:hypothetical protein
MGPVAGDGHGKSEKIMHEPTEDEIRSFIPTSEQIAAPVTVAPSISLTGSDEIERTPTSHSIELEYSIESVETNKIMSRYSDNGRNDVYFNLWNTDILRGNSVVVDGCIVHTYRGVSRTFLWNDVIGPDSRYEFVAVTGTEFAIIVKRNAKRFRYLTTGITPQELGKVQRALSLRRSDKDPMNSSLYYNTVCQVIKNEQWISEIFRRSSNFIVDDLTATLRSYDYAKSKLFLDACRYEHVPSYFEHFCSYFSGFNPGNIITFLLSIFTFSLYTPLIGLSYFSFSYNYVKVFMNRLISIYSVTFRHYCVNFVKNFTEIKYASQFDKFVFIIVNFNSFLLTVIFVSLGIPIYSYEIIKAFRQLAFDTAMTVKEGASFLFATLLTETPQRNVKALGSYVPVPISLPYNNISNFLSAQRIRQMKFSGKVKQSRMTKFLKRSKELFDKIDVYSVQVPLFKEWLQTRKWSIYKKLNCDRLFEGFCTHNTTRKSFLKSEVTLTDSKSAARVICANDNDIQATNGPMMAAVKSWLCKVSRNTRVIFTCGMDRNELGRLQAETSSRYSDPHFMSGDFSKFDSTVGEDLMEIERMVYKKLLPTHKREVEAFIDRCQSDFKAIMISKGFKAGVAIPVSRGSGDPNTTVGNSLLNYAFWMYIFDLLSDKHAMNQATAYVCGDDVHLVGSKQDLEQLHDFVIEEKILLNLGTVIEFTEITGMMSQSEYLSGTFIRGVVDVVFRSYKKDEDPVCRECEHIVHIAKPGRVLSKIMTTAKVWRNDAEFKILRNSKLDALRTECWIFPLLCEKISNFLLTQSPDSVQRDIYKMGYSKRPRICENTEVDFQSRYGVSLYAVDLYLATNFKFDCVTRLSGDLIRAVVLVDTGLDIIDSDFYYDEIDANANRMDIYADLDSYISNDISGDKILL